MKKIKLTFSLFLTLLSCQNKDNIKKENIKNVIANNNISKCVTDELNKDFIDTDTTTFEIGTKLFWNYNCDSIWQTYINTNGEKIILDNFKEDIYVNYPFHLSYLQDYKKTILFQRRVISGCCDLPDNLIFDKKTGKEIENIGPIVWYSKKRKYPLVILFESNDSVKSNVHREFNNLVIYNLDNDKQYVYSLNKHGFFKNLEDKYFNYDFSLIEDYKVLDNKLELMFIKIDTDNEKEYIKDTINLDLENYCE